MKPASRAPRTDGEATRARILEAAGTLFAAKGFAETPSKAIAAQAAVDLASINYHFGSRSGLYQAVLAEAHRWLVDFADLQRMARSALPASDKLRALIEQLVQRTMDDTDHWQLNVLAAELLAPSSHLEVLLQSEVPMKLSLITAILQDITGIPAGDPALLRCFLSVAAPCMVLLIGRRGIPGPLQELRHMPSAAIVDHLHGFAVAGLQAVAEDHARQRGAAPA